MEIFEKAKEDEAKLRLDRKPKAAFSAARQGSVYDVIAIATALEDGKIPLRLRDSCATAIIDAVIILTKEQGLMNKGGAWWATAACIRAIEYLGPNYFKIREKIKERLMTALPHLSGWVIHSLTVVLLEDDPDDEDDFSNCEGILLGTHHALNLIYTFDEDGDRSADILGTYDTLKLATRVWLRDAPVEENAFAAHCLYLIFLISKNGPACQPGTHHVMHTIALDLNLTSDDIVRVALTRVQTAESTTQTQLLAFVPLLFSSQVGEPAFQQAVMDQRGIQIVLRTIRNVFEEIEYDFRSPDVSGLEVEDAATVSNGFLVLFGMIQCLPSWDALKRALHCGLIRFLAYSSTACAVSRLGKDGEIYIRDILKNVLMKSIRIRQVLLATKRAICKIKILAPFVECENPKTDAPSQFSESPLLDIWEDFLTTVRHHLKSLEVFSSERKKEEVPCGNVKCEHKGLRSQLRKCAGCEFVYYCSRACQTTAWRGQNHRKICKICREKREYSGITTLDADYLARSARNDIRKSTFGAMSKLRSDPFSIPFDERYVAISYAETTSKERNIDSFSTTFFNWEVVKRDMDPFVFRLHYGEMFPFEITPKAWDTRVTTLKTYEEDIEVLIMVKYKLGGSHRSIFFSSPLKKAVFEGRMCACCRFHDVITDHNGLCLVHRAK